MICSKCKTEMIKFGAYKCKTCRDNYHREWRKKNRVKWNASSRNWIAQNKEKRKEAVLRYESSVPILEMRRKNYRIRVEEGRQKKYIGDPMIRREIKNRYRARKLNAVSEKYAAKDIFEKYQHLCVYCGTEAKCLDHVVPLSRGGQDVISNLVAACKPCNTSKGAKLLSEWRN